MKPAEDLAGVLKHRTEIILAGIRSRDMTAVVALFAEDALYSPSGDVLLADRAALAAYWNSVLDSPARDAVLEVLKIVPIAADAFVEIQRYEVFDAEGSRLFGGHASLLWRRIEGRWRIAADVSNS